MELSKKNASPETLAKLAAKLKDIEENDPRRTDTNWTQIHLYLLLGLNMTTGEVEGNSVETKKHNAALKDLGEEFPDLVL